MTYEHAKTLLSVMPIETVRELAFSYVHEQQGVGLTVVQNGKVRPSADYVIGLAQYVKSKRTH